MNYKVKTIPNFERSLKRLVKKYASLKQEYVALVERLEAQPQQGSALGNHCFKLRISIASKGKGKSGGARLITHVLVRETTVFLLDIFDKAVKENITDKELVQLVREIKT